MMEEESWGVLTKDQFEKLLEQFGITIETK